MLKVKDSLSILFHIKPIKSARPNEKASINLIKLE